MKKVARGQTSTGVTVNEKGWGWGIRVLGNNTKFSKHVFILMQILHGVNEMPLLSPLSMALGRL